MATETKNSSPVTEGKTVTAPTAPKRTGYTFTTGEWYTEPECINKWTVGTGGDPVTSDMTLYAKWTPKTYTVKFMNGTTAFKTVTQEYDSMLGPPQENPTKEGHRFDGWYADKTCEQPWDFTKPFAPSGTSTTVSIYAKWNINSYEVTFETDSGTEIAPVKVEYNKKVSKPSPNPEKTGYTFVNWYKEIGRAHV